MDKLGRCIREELHKQLEARLWKLDKQLLGQLRGLYWQLEEQLYDQLDDQLWGQLKEMKNE